MISVLAHKINQWTAGQRCLLLLSVLACVYLAWYFFLEKPLLQGNHAIIAQQAQDQKLEQELSAFSQMQGNFVYKNDLGQVHFRQIFQAPLSVTPKLSMTNYTDLPVVALPAGAAQFSSLATALNLVLSNTFQQFSATLVFSGQFKDFVTYLNVLQNNSQAIYFDSIHFNMNRYPNAEITIKVFALEG